MPVAATQRTSHRKTNNLTDIESRLADLIAAPFDSDEFIFKFIEIFNAPKASLTKLRSGTMNKAGKAGGLLWKPKLYYSACEAGRTAEMLDELKARKPAQTHKPRFFIATDGQEFSAFDSKTDESLHCDFSSLNDHFDFFKPLAGIENYKDVEENSADRKAASRLSKLHEEIIRVNLDWGAEERHHALNQFMTRLLFCMFAEDAGGFEKNLLVKTISEYGGEAGEDLQALLSSIFQVLNIPIGKRSKKIPERIRAFPYVNGGLFADDIEVPVFSKRAKRLMIEAAELDWRDIHPDIFGSMIQAVVDPKLRGDLGIHYTSESNIMKVLQPLFLMSLEEDFDKAMGHREERALLDKLLKRIHNIRVFDPACGSGNFLIIAYRELRALEMRIFQRQRELGGTRFKHPDSQVKLSNFYGIELADFAAETAKLSLWIMEYQMNRRSKNLFGEASPDFPLKEGGHVHMGNALRLDWEAICPPPDRSNEDVETYLVGNPPYLGSTWQSKTQKADLAHVFSPITNRYKNLDYVAAWYLKGAQYCSSQQAQCAFVATNSICQGQQVALLWPLIFDQGIEISFAYQSFKWKNLAAKNAGVTCVIAGLRQHDSQPKYLYEGETYRQVDHIGPYLIQMQDITVHKATSPFNGMPEMEYGNKPTDGGNLILSPPEKDHLLAQYPQAALLVRRLYGSQELIRGIERYCLWIRDEDLPLARSILPIAERIKKVRRMRKASTKESTREAAKTPHKFGEIRDFIAEHAIIIPSISSENRPYLPVDILTDGSVIQNKAFAIYDGPVWAMAVIASKMHKVWIETVCVRLRSDFSYSNTLGYNTFPLPPLSNEQKQTLEKHAWDIIAARDTHPGKTIAWLYDPKTMPENLLAAHQALDDSLEKIYIGRPFKNDTERLEHLFKRYIDMTSTQTRSVVNA